MNVGPPKEKNISKWVGKIFLMDWVMSLLIRGRSTAFLHKEDVIVLLWTWWVSVDLVCLEHLTGWEYYSAVTVLKQTVLSQILSKNLRVSLGETPHNMLISLSFLGTVYRLMILRGYPRKPWFLKRDYSVRHYWGFSVTTLWVPSNLRRFFNQNYVSYILGSSRTSQSNPLK